MNKPVTKEFFIGFMTDYRYHIDQKFDSFRAELGELKDEVGELRIEMREGFSYVAEKFENYDRKLATIS